MPSLLWLAFIIPVALAGQIRIGSGDYLQSPRKCVKSPSNTMIRYQRSDGSIVYHDRPTKQEVALLVKATFG
ncbi:hypothetical protein TELCIR_16481 [Teladorsagia circumcincta]|uniref:Uncharacterized protein n=1 Tax=Teladorsagia circumcincta TaxID=45464 RepID=A0A2G9TXK7_TELCI|nr:hypothetical protein TELCIR_16481 [Teladorsagia circumcincta]